MRQILLLLVQLIDLLLLLKLLKLELAAELILVRLEPRRAHRPRRRRPVELLFLLKLLQLLIASEGVQLLLHTIRPHLPSEGAERLLELVLLLLLLQPVDLLLLLKLKLPQVWLLSFRQPGMAQEKQAGESRNRYTSHGLLLCSIKITALPSCHRKACAIF